MRFSVTGEGLCHQEGQTFAGTTGTFCVQFWKCQECIFLCKGRLTISSSSSSNKMHFKVKSDHENSVFVVVVSLIVHFLDFTQSVHHPLNPAAYTLQKNDFTAEALFLFLLPRRCSGRAWVGVCVGASFVHRAKHCE